MLCNRLQIGLFRSITFVNQSRYISCNLIRNRIYGGKLQTMSFKEDPLFQRIIENPEVILLSDLFKKYGYSLRFAGGPVRDLLMGIEPKDLDFATTATPNQMKEMFNTEGIRVINALGEKHGTITARINDKENYEITTLRIDKITDGRHAVVEFTSDWKLDANRRDLTFNSMYMDLDGILYDYFEGRKDLMERKVNFVGEADERIKEDYLRILRYFRFYGRIADKPDLHEDHTIKTIEDNAEGLKQISGERIWLEWRKILEGRFGVELTLKMIECNLSQYIGLPENPNVEEFKRICSKNIKDNRITLLPTAAIASLLKNDEEMEALDDRLKLSTFERDMGYYVINNCHLKPDMSDSDILKHFKFTIINCNSKISFYQQWAVQTLCYLDKKQLANELENWQIPRLPVNGGDIVDEHNVKGKVISLILQELKKIWRDQDFSSSKEDLLKEIPHILDKISHQKVDMDKPMWSKKKRRKPNK